MSQQQPPSTPGTDVPEQPTGDPVPGPVPEQPVQDPPAFPEQDSPGEIVFDEDEVAK